MYLPKHFAQTDIATLHALIGAHPLATLVTHGPEGLDANHIPLHLDAGAGANGTLRGHIARANPLAGNAAVDGEILAIFQGPQSYISPSGYATKAEHGKVVPTWNYTAVHAGPPAPDRRSGLAAGAGAHADHNARGRAGAPVAG